MTFSRAQIEAVENPTLVVWGAESIFVDHSKALAEALPDAERREIVDANHALVEQAPDQIAEVDRSTAFNAGERVTDFGGITTEAHARTDRPVGATCRSALAVATARSGPTRSVAKRHRSEHPTFRRRTVLVH